MNNEIISKVSEQLSISISGITSVLTMIEEGATIPFIARYRKEKTGNLDEEEIRKIVQTYEYEDKLFTRKNEVIRLIEEKGKLTDELKEAILAATVLKTVEDLYLPYKEKKKTRAGVALANGLENLYKYMISFHKDDINKEAEKYLNEKVTTVEAAIQGAKDILAESISDNIVYRDYLRNSITKYGKVVTAIKKDAVDDRKVYAGYYEYEEPVRFIANHRILAINRGEKEDVLKVSLCINDEDFVAYLKRKVIGKLNNSAIKYIEEAVEDSYKRLLYPSIEREIRNELTDRAQEDAIKLFTVNLEQLLLTPPLKNKILLGLDPSFRTGCKLAVILGNGDFVVKDVIYPHQKFVGENVPAWRKEEAEKKVVTLVNKYKVELIAIGNGTASRESEEFIANTIKKYSLPCKYIIVSEAGASVYSASDLARKEFPDLVVEERSAISIARRVLDPLAELIKIDPKSIGVGQYQHDVNQSKLEDGLDFTITKVVNNVGVNINSASASLLSYVSGLTKKSAESIVNYRSENGQISSRAEIKKIKGIGPKSYEQAVGFLKILESKNPLDKTFIHPENYEFVKELLRANNLDIKLIGTPEFATALESINAEAYAKLYGIGEYSLNDILNELKRPLRDIRDEYPTPILKSDILHAEDLKPGMKLQGTVRSIVDFGCFVDIGLKNDGMVHKSKMSKQKVNHPLDIVNIGDIVTVYVLEIDKVKNRIALSLLDPREE